MTEEARGLAVSYADVKVFDKDEPRRYWTKGNYWD
jgi:hypothetical protein